MGRSVLCFIRSGAAGAGANIASSVTPFFVRLRFVNQFTSELMHAKIGTPRNMPSTPPKPPPTTMATMTQKLEMPVDLPRIFGPRILPSNCCNAMMKRMK